MEDDEDWADQDWADDPDADYVDEADDHLFTCPECGAETHADADACPACGYWFTEADRSAAWRAGSASGRIVTIGLWLLGLAAVAVLYRWLR